MATSEDYQFNLLVEIHFQPIRSDQFQRQFSQNNINT